MNLLGFTCVSGHGFSVSIASSRLSTNGNKRNGHYHRQPGIRSTPCTPLVRQQRDQNVSSWIEMIGVPGYVADFIEWATALLPPESD